MIKKMTEFNALIWKNYLKEGMTVLDATLGNGHDALLFKNCIGESGILYGFDIQQEAIDASKKRLIDSKNVCFFLESHEHIKNYISINSLDAIVYNLGFLPGGNKRITTKCESTFKSIESALLCLKEGGMMSVSVYPGHSEGADEAEMLNRYLAHLDPKDFHVMKQEYCNQPFGAPYTYWLVKSHAT